MWYSGCAGDLWVEYKYIRKLPVHTAVRIYDLLSAQQMRWLNDRFAEGRHVAVVLGSPLGAWIFEDNAWQTLDVTRQQIVARRLDQKAVADYIRRKTMP